VLNDLDAAIRTYAAVNPKASAEAIAKRFGQPKADIMMVLGRTK
jgi:hypothetical protein